jgi:putative ABC transport system permease protein
MKVVVRANGDPGRLAAAVRAEILSIDPEILVDDPGTMRERIAGSVAPRRIAAVLLSSFALLALLISAVGLYSVISFGVAQRTREIGIRVAMGARRADVRRLVMGQALKLALAGVLLGAAGSFALLRVLDRFLYDIGSDDPGTLFFVSILLTAVALLASWLPAQRAARVDPMVALRTE